MADNTFIATQILKRKVSISTDSRKIKRGDIFIAIKGKRYDGHDFVCDVFRKGASKVIVSKNVSILRKYRDGVIKVNDTIYALGEIARIYKQRHRVSVVAVTGSNGKTTTKDMIYYVLSSKLHVLRNDGSENNLIGLPLTVLKLKRIHRVAVLEMGMNHLGEIKRLSEIACPDVGVITNIAPAHLQYMHSLENILRAKLELVHSLKNSGVAILNKDDPYLREVKHVKCKIVYFGIKNKSDIMPSSINYDNNKWSFRIGDRTKITLPILGYHNIYNALAAVSVAKLFGFSLSIIKERLESFRILSPMRLNLEKAGGIEIINDTYNSNPYSFKSALDTLLRYDTIGRKVVVAGDMLELGRYAKKFHESIGREISRYGISLLITVGKLSKYINNVAKENGIRSAYHAKTLNRAHILLKRLTRPGDVVLVKGSRNCGLEKLIDKLCTGDVSYRRI